MKLKRLIFLVMVPLVAAMGPKPDGEADAHRPFVRDVVPAGRIQDDSAPRPEVPAQELQVLDAADATPDQFLWQARLVVVFADTAADPAFIEQMAALRRDPKALLARSVVVVTDTDPAAASIWRRQLRPRGFSMLLLDKDGQVKQRMPTPRSVREITRAIDSFTLRRQEVGAPGLP